MNLNPNTVELLEDPSALSNVNATFTEHRVISRCFGIYSVNVGLIYPETERSSQEKVLVSKFYPYNYLGIDVRLRSHRALVINRLFTDECFPYALDLSQIRELGSNVVVPVNNELSIQQTFSNMVSTWPNVTGVKTLASNAVEVYFYGPNDGRPISAIQSYIHVNARFLEIESLEIVQCIEFTNTRRYICRISPVLRRSMEQRKMEMFFGDQMVPIFDHTGLFHCYFCLAFNLGSCSCGFTLRCPHCSSSPHGIQGPQPASSHPQCRLRKCCNCASSPVPINGPDHRYYELDCCPRFIKMLKEGLSVFKFEYKNVYVELFRRHP